jgi:hypothetical protein
MRNLVVVFVVLCLCSLFSVVAPAADASFIRLGVGDKHETVAGDVEVGFNMASGKYVVVNAQFDGKHAGTFTGGFQVDIAKVKDFGFYLQPIRAGVAQLDQQFRTVYGSAVGLTIDLNQRFCVGASAELQRTYDMNRFNAPIWKPAYFGYIQIAFGKKGQ